VDMNTQSDSDVYNIDTTMAAEEPPYLDLDIRREDANVFSDP
jgi:hypothetical protein